MSSRNLEDEGPIFVPRSGGRSHILKMFDDKKMKSVPGPGNYPIKSQAFEPGKGYAMGLKLKEMSKMVVPGSGTYEPNTDT